MKPDEEFGSLLMQAHKDYFPLVVLSMRSLSTYTMWCNAIFPSMKEWLADGSPEMMARYNAVITWNGAVPLVVRYHIDHGEVDAAIAGCRYIINNAPTGMSVFPCVDAALLSWWAEAKDEALFFAQLGVSQSANTLMHKQLKFTAMLLEQELPFTTMLSGLLETPWEELVAIHSPWHTYGDEEETSDWTEKFFGGTDADQ